jgi:predicted DNA-binding protein YlxM (UPF0122 family)
MDHMAKRTKFTISENISLPLPSAEDLRGRQSVRATFKLSTRAIDALSIVAVHLGIKQKSLFDQLIEDAGSLSHIAREIESDDFSTLERVQKTYVISRKTLRSLEEISRQFDAPRDALVEYSIQRLLPVIAREREKHQKRKEILEDINAHFEEGLKILKKTRELLGENDPVYTKLEAAMGACMHARDNIDQFVERCQIIEEF